MNCFNWSGNQEHRHRRGAGHQAAGNSEERDLACGDATTGKTAFNVLGVSFLMRILKTDAGRFQVLVIVIVIMVVSISGKLGLVGVGVISVL